MLWISNKIMYIKCLINVRLDHDTQLRWIQVGNRHSVIIVGQRLKLGTKRGLQKCQEQTRFLRSAYSGKQRINLMIRVNSIMLVNAKEKIFQHFLYLLYQGGDDYDIGMKTSFKKWCNEIIAEIRVVNCKRAIF